MTVQPQLSLLLAVEGVSLSSGEDSRTPMTETVAVLQQALATIASMPLRGQNQSVITDVMQVAASSNGEWLAAGGADGRVHIWSLAAGGPEVAQTTLGAHTGAVTAVAFSPDGRWLSTGGADAVVNLFDLRVSPPAPIKIPLDQAYGPVSGIAFGPTADPTKPWLTVSRKEGVVQSINLSPFNSPRVAVLLSEARKDMTDLTFSPNGQWLATVNGDTALRVWSLPGQDIALRTARLLSAGKEGGITFAFSPDGRWLAAGNNSDSGVYLYDLAQPDVSPFLLPGHEQGVQAIAFDPESGSRSVAGSHPISLPFGTLAVGSGDGIVRLWVLDLLTRTTEIKTEPIPTRPGATASPVQVAPKLASKAAEPTFIPANMEPLRLLQRPGAILALTFAKEKGESAKLWLAVAGADRTVMLWDIGALSAPKYIVYGHDEAVTSVFWGMNAGLIFTQSQDGTARVWNRETVPAPLGLAQLIEELPKWIDEACHRAGRDFHPSERVQYLGDLQVQSICGVGNID